MRSTRQIASYYDVETWIPEETELDTELKPDHCYSDGNRVGDFEAVHVPGHSDDSYAFINKDEKFAILGDTVVGSDIRGLPKRYFAVHGEIFTDDIRAVEQNLEKPTEYDFDVGLVFHGSSVLEDASEKSKPMLTG